MTLCRKFGNPGFQRETSGDLKWPSKLSRFQTRDTRSREMVFAHERRMTTLRWCQFRYPSRVASGPSKKIMSAHGQISHIPISKLEGRLTVAGVSVLLAYLTGFVVYMTWPGNYCPTSSFLSDLFFPLLWLLSPIIPCC